MRLIIGVLSFLLAFCASADAHDPGISDMVPCAPFVNADGTQVLETYRLPEGTCEWASSTLVRITDFREEVVCSYTAETCKHVSQLEAAGRTHYDSLKEIWEKERGNRIGCRPRTDNKTFRTDMAPAPNGFGCGANISAVRHYDFVIMSVSFMDGKGKIFGRLGLSSHRRDMVLASKAQ